MYTDFIVLPLEVTRSARLFWMHEIAQKSREIIKIDQQVKPANVWKREACEYVCRRCRRFHVTCHAISFTGRLKSGVRVRARWLHRQHTTVAPEYSPALSGAFVLIRYCGWMGDCERSAQLTITHRNRTTFGHMGALTDVSINIAHQQADSPP